LLRSVLAWGETGFFLSGEPILQQWLRYHQG
jgi:hypothetical protein